MANNSIEKKPALHQDELWQEYVRKIRKGEIQPFEDQLTVFRKIFSNQQNENGPPKAWQPEDKHLNKSNISRFMNETGHSDYDDFHKWSTENRIEFWQNVISKLDIRFNKKPEKILDLADGVIHPHWLPGAEFNCVDSCFKSQQDKTAIILAKENSSEHIKVTYIELENLVNRVANGLKDIGFEPGDRIALYMPMNVECVASYLGIIRAGCQIVSIADSFSPAEVQKRLELAKAKWVITVNSYQRGGRPIHLYDKIKDAGDLRAIVLPSDQSSTKSNDIQLRDKDILWEEFLSANTHYRSQQGTASTIINILFSSGTTGTPKIIPWTHLTPIKSAMDGKYHQDIHSGDVVAWPTNIGWMMGPWLIFASLINNATMALYEGSPLDSGFINFICSAKVNILGVIPSLVRAWRSAGYLEDSNWNHMHCFSSTGEPSNFEDYLWLMSRTGYRAPVIEYLGGTEIGGGHITGSIVKAASPATFNSPALGIDFILLNENNQIVNENETGELYLIPPSIGLSQILLNKNHDDIYYNNCPTGPKGETLRRHGDRFIKLPNGFYKAQGRSDDTMNLGGIKVSAIELEQVIGGHELIQENAAVSVQLSGEGQEKLVVYAVLKSTIEKYVLKNEINLLLAKKLNPLYKIYDVLIVNSLPRTASNKLMRRKLRSLYIEKFNKD